MQRTISSHILAAVSLVIQRLSFFLAGYQLGETITLSGFNSAITKSSTVNAKTVHKFFPPSLNPYPEQLHGFGGNSDDFQQRETFLCFGGTYWIRQISPCENRIEFVRKRIYHITAQIFLRGLTSDFSQL